MPSTAPTLTWNMTNIRVPAVATDPDEVLNTIKLCVDDATYWELDAAAFGGGGAVGDNYRIFTPVGGNQPNMQVIVCHTPHDDMILKDVSPAPTPAGRADWGSNGNNGNHTNANKATSIFIGLCPEGGATADPLAVGGPCSGSGERFTGYWKISDDLAADQWNQVFCLNSDESLGFWGNEIAVEDWYGGIAGAILDPPTDADGQGTPGRLYGMMVTGKQLISATFWTTVSGFSGVRNTSNSEAVAIFDPSNPNVMRVQSRMVTTLLTAPRYLTIGGTQVSFPYGYFEVTTPFNFYGIGRQMRCTTDGLMREVIQDSGGNDKSYRIGGSTLAAGDVVSFDNG
jgi:hypothetical protein